MEALYDEMISPTTAKRILGTDDLGFKDVTCKLISSLDTMVVLVHDNETGAEVEHSLDSFDEVFDTSMETIESKTKEVLGKSTTAVVFKELIRLLALTVIVALFAGILVYLFFK